MSRSGETSASSYGHLYKRSPLPQPFDSCRAGSSYTAASSREIVRPNDYLGFVNRAIERAQKDNPRSNNDFRSIDGALKWLKRAQASMLRDPIIVDEIRNAYTSKLYRTDLTLAQRENIQEKLAQWTRYRNMPVHEEMQNLIYNVDRSYQEDIDYLQPYPDYKPDHLRHAREALRLWGSNLDRATAFRMVKKELELYVESSLHGSDPDTEMSDHAVKAIAWLTRARNLQ